MDLDRQGITELAYARFFRTLGAAAFELAQEIESRQSPGPGSLSLDNAGLGSLQRQVADAPGMRSETGMSPRQIAKHLDRDDEPNIRTALTAMQKRGVTELIPGVSPQRWRLALPYRKQE